MKDLIINIFLLIFASALVFIPLFWNVKKNTKSKKFFKSISFYGWICIIILLLAIGLGTRKEYLNNLEKKVEKSKASNQRIIDSLAIRKMNEAIIELGYIYNKGTERIEKNFSTINNLKTEEKNQNPFLSLYNTPENQNPLLNYISNPNQFKFTIKITNNSKADAFHLIDHVFLIALSNDTVYFSNSPLDYQTLNESSMIKSGDWLSIPYIFQLPYRTKKDSVFLYFKLSFSNEKGELMPYLRRIYFIPTDNEIVVEPPQKDFNRLKLHFQRNKLW